MELQTPITTTNNNEPIFEDFDSTCSTPYVSAPSSPGRGPTLPGFFYSAPASPMHFAITASSSYETTPSSAPMGYEFEFSARLGPTGPPGPASMSSADELFLNGQIRPMKLSSHLQRPQVLSPLLDLEEEEDEDDETDAVSVNVNVSVIRGRDLRLRDKSLRRRTRSMSPLRSNTPLEWDENEYHHNIHSNDTNDSNVKLGKQINNRKGNCINGNGNGNGNGEGFSEAEKVEDGLGLETTRSVSGSASSSRSSSAGRSSKRWVFLKDFLRSKSEGRSNNKFWSTISFSPTKDKKSTTTTTTNQNLNIPLSKDRPNGPETSHKSKESASQAWARRMSGKPTNGVGKRRVPPSPHELHYKANRAQSEELRKKTFLPYRQGLLGCLGFSSKGYGAMNGFARALNPVSSR